MAKTISMQDMRQLNLFNKVTHISTRFSFQYNEAIMFCVPRHLVSKAVGEQGRNIRRMSEILRKRIKVIAAASGIEDARRFIEDIVSPVTFKDLEIKNDEMIITAGSQNKAALLGRNKRRLLELQKIVADYFEKDLRII